MRLRLSAPTVAGDRCAASPARPGVGADRARRRSTAARWCRGRGADSAGQRRLARCAASPLTRSPPDAPATAPAPWQRAAVRRRRAVLLADRRAVGDLRDRADAANAQPLVGHRRGCDIVPGARCSRLLFAWVTAGFVTAMMGFCVLLARRPRTRCRARGVGHQPDAAPRRAPRSSCRSATRTSRPCSPACAPPAESLGRNGCGAPVRRVRAVRHQRPGDPRRRTAPPGPSCASALGDGARVYYRWRTLRTKPQGRQRGRLLPPLGPRLPLHGGARRRQRDERRLPGDAGAPDGSESAAPASCRPRRRPAG